MEVFWDSINPMLDVDDNNDATMRLNSLQLLNDYEMVSFGLERAPLIEVRGLGIFSLRAIELAEGKTSPVGDEQVQDVALIQGAFGNADAEVITALGEGVRGSIAQLKRITELWSELATDAPGLNFDEILKVLEEIRQAVNKYAPVTAESIEEDISEGMDENQTQGIPVSVSGTINSRTDVIKVIDKICEYYTSNEPSSPIPLLLRRAQRLVSMSFVEILEDMAPDGVAQAQIISGDKE